MGSYLEIDHREINCKSLSHTLMSAIRMFHGDSEVSKYFIPESINKEGVGVGNWVIKRKGIAILVGYFKEVIEDVVIEDDEWDYKYIYNYLVDILTDMVLEGKKKVYAVWR